MSDYIPRLLNNYNKEIKSSLSKKLNISNIMRIPKLIKISINMGFGQARLNENQLKAAIEELSIITSQKAVITRAKQAISNLK
jgi:Ribosomal protein L5